MRAVIDRVLAAYAAHAGVELAATLGVVDSYVTKLRGGWRPTRVRADLWARLLALDPERAAPAPQSAAYYDGVLFAAQAMSETITRLLAEARAGLQRGEPATPTAAEIVAGVAALDAAAPSAAAPRSTRPARSRPA